ncbi:MAG: ComEC/Rec2 family competence protein [Corynebacterium sp.]|nr:ComEC/Rec2 family competence protein [Corynebacterium sp.]
MFEFRLFPAAVTVWLVTWLVVSGHPVWWAFLLLPLVVVQRGQAVVCLCLGALAWIVSRQRSGEVKGTIGTVVGTPREGYVRVRIEGQEVPFFPREVPEDLRAGDIVDMTRGVEVIEKASTWAVDRLSLLPEREQGLVVGMVLGDVSQQTPADRQLYIDTGLSHLSAVSGANVAVVLTCVFLFCRFLGVGPLWQVFFGALALAGFVALVGPEPSVLRAAMTGIVALLAVVNSSRVQPQHALCLGICVLLFVDSYLATSFGFALSVAATASIVLLSPLLTRLLSGLRLPEVLTRAMAVSIAADMATMPLIALMTGKVSLVSVVANVLVAPATAPITVVGLAAIIIRPLMWLTYPFAWWIVTVAENVPPVTVEMSPLGAVLLYAWVIVVLSWAVR